MFESVTVDHFRGFRKLEVGSLDRFNLVLGRNNSGKTALLEAIFLLCGPTNPELPMTLNALRGIDQLRNDAEELWGWLFFEKNVEGKIRLEARTDKGRSRELFISLEPTREVKLRPQHVNRKKQSRMPPSVASTAAPRTELKLRYLDESGKEHLSRSTIREAALTYERDSFVRYPETIFVTSKLIHVAENSRRWSQLEEVGRAESLIPHLKLFDPRLKRLTVLVTGMGPILHADLGIGRMVPLPFMGEGLGRVLTILLSIAECKNGILLVDEFDNGLHYSTLVEAWKAVASFAREYDVQVIATSHSWECVRAAHASFEETRHYDFRLYRMESRADSSSMVIYDKESLETAIEEGIEVR